MKNSIVICAYADSDPIEGLEDFFKDNIQGACSNCKAKIVFRPHLEEAQYKLCPRCGLLLILKKGVKPELAPESFKELMEIKKIQSKNKK